MLSSISRINVGNVRTILQTTVMLTLSLFFFIHISLFCSLMFLWVQFSAFCNTVLMCLLGYKHKQHLVRFRKRSCFSLKYDILSPETLLENVWMSVSKMSSGFCTYKMLKHSLEPWSWSWQPSHWAVTPLASPRPPNMRVSLYTCNVNVIWSIVVVLRYIWHVDIWTYQWFAQT